MQAAADNINRIQVKLQDLLKRHAAMLRENEQQLKLISTLQEQQQQQENKIRILEEQQHILRAAAGNMNDAHKKDFEQVIGRYVKEIDKCIDLLKE